MPQSEAQLRATFTKHYPDRDWNQSCQAAVAHSAEYTSGKATFYLTAKDAYEASNIVSTNHAKAKLNDVHYWAIGAAWHTGVDLGNGRIFMASKHSDGSFGKNLGVTTVAAYTEATGAQYRGFARANGVNRVQIAKPKATGRGSARVRLVAAYLNAEKLGKRTTAAEDGIVDQTGKVVQVYWWLCQRWGQIHGMYGAGYKLDGRVKRVGGQTRKVEAEIYKRAKAAAKK